MWLPIETAPKDGTWVLGCWWLNGRWAYRLVAFDMEAWQQKPGDAAAPVTHWIPLPVPPEE